jgi:hypothetical protein
MEDLILDKIIPIIDSNDIDTLSSHIDNYLPYKVAVVYCIDINNFKILEHILKSKTFNKINSYVYIFPVISSDNVKAFKLSLKLFDVDINAWNSLFLYEAANTNKVNITKFILSKSRKEKINNRIVDILVQCLNKNHMNILDLFFEDENYFKIFISPFFIKKIFEQDNVYLLEKIKTKMSIEKLNDYLYMAYNNYNFLNNRTDFIITQALKYNAIETVNFFIREDKEILNFINEDIFKRYPILHTLVRKNKIEKIINR